MTSFIYEIYAVQSFLKQIS